MKLLADRDERFKGLFVKVSFFVLLAVAGVVLNLVFTGVKKGLFTPKSSIYFVAESGQDIKEGMPVKLSGFKIGSVKSISLNDMAQARVEMAIENQYLPLLDENAIVSLKKEGVIGDSILELRRSARGKQALAAGATVRFERGSGLEQIAQDLRDRLFPALDEINKLLRDANDPQGDVRQTLKNLREFSVELHGTRARIDHVLDQVDAGVSEDVRPMLQSARRSAESVEHIATKLDTDVPRLAGKADATLDNLQQTSATIRSSVASAAPQLPGLLGDSRGMVNDARRIEETLSTSWPLNKVIPAPEHGMVKMDSHD